jgi:hypothetical protein
MKLTPRQRDVLTKMAAAEIGSYEAELVYEHGVGYLGDEVVGAKTVLALLRFAAIRAEHHNAGDIMERYSINETGRELLAGGDTLKVIKAARARRTIG